VSADCGATLDDAIERGLPFYLTPKKCTFGHDSPRYVKSRQCVQCTRTRNAASAARRRPVPIPKVEDSEPTAPEREIRDRDPGTRISPERISACIDRIFGDAPRLGSEALRGAA
jgi:hypothetical protein